MMRTQEQPKAVTITGLHSFAAQCNELVRVVDLLDLSPLHSIASDVFVSRFHVLLNAIERFFEYEESLLDRYLISGEVRRLHVADHERIRQILRGIHQDSIRKKNQTAIEVYQTIRHEIEQHVLNFSFDVSRCVPASRH